MKQKWDGPGEEVLTAAAMAVKSDLRQPMHALN
jgi:hypothetical protein